MWGNGAAMWLILVAACGGSGVDGDTGAPDTAAGAPDPCALPDGAVPASSTDMPYVGGCSAFPDAALFGGADALVLEDEAAFLAALACDAGASSALDWVAERVVYLRVAEDNPDVRVAWIAETAEGLTITLDVPAYCGGANPIGEVFEAGLLLPVGPAVVTGRCASVTECGDSPPPP